jgi:hypothetical protein
MSTEPLDDKTSRHKVHPLQHLVLPFASFSPSSIARITVCSAKERVLINGYLTSVFLVGTSTSMKVTNLNVNDLKIASHQA